MAQITESEFIDRFLKRVCELHPNAEPTDLVEYSINNAAHPDTSPEQAAEIFAAEIADHWLSIGRHPIPVQRKRRTAKT